MAPREPSQGPIDKSIPIRLPDPWRICLVLRHAFLIQAVANPHAVPSSS